MMHSSILFALVPLFLLIGTIPIGNASESDQICIDKVWIENSKGKIACVSPSTADKLVERGWGTLLDDLFSEHKACTLDYSPVCGVDGEVYGNICALESSNTELAYRGECTYTGQYGIDYDAEINLIPLADGGMGPLTVTPVIGEPPKEYPKLYVPGEEELAEDEIRLSFCGTGMPFVTYAQASACVIVETGDDKAYLFDIGSGSIGRINAMKIHGNDLTNVFVSHTHTDHIGDITSFWSQAYLSGRSVPIELYGPSGANHELGLTYFVENFLKTYKWDFETRRGLIATSGQAINVHEFDYTKTQVIYDQDNFRVTAFPAIHGIDGAVSFRMDWKDLSVVFAGDTNINQFIIENSQNADVVIMETFTPAEYYMEYFGWPEGMYEDSIAKHHVPAERAGLYYEVVQPKFAVSYHQTLDENSTPMIFEDIRENYDGPYLFAQDFTIVNLTPDYILTRQADVDTNSLPVVTEKMVVTDERIYFTSEWLEDSVLYEDDLRKMIEEKNGS